MTENKEIAPKSLRLQIALFGRANVGKSSVLNLIVDQDTSIVSNIAGTTTDVVEKAFEILPIGPVNFLDTAGLDDKSGLSQARIAKTIKILDRADAVIIVIEPNVWTDYEEKIYSEIIKRNLKFFILVNKIDTEKISCDFLKLLNSKSQNIVQISATDEISKITYRNNIKQSLLKLELIDLRQNLPLLGDLIKPGALCIFVVPIDLQAPKGRLILPQVESIRDVLDNDASVLVVKEKEYKYVLGLLNTQPDLVVCDSQVVLKMVADTPENVKCTTFSILFSRFKGSLEDEVRGVAAIDKLTPNDKVLIAEACSHHALEDDIAHVKIPRWLRQYLGFTPNIEFSRGRDYPDNLSDYRVIIHCGACMLTQNEKRNRVQFAKQNNIPITNYGMTIALTHGVLKRVLEPFPGVAELGEEN